MIIRENNDEFIMIAQHDHALVSGEIARHFNPEYFLDLDRKEDVLLAVKEHDRGWIGMDAVPVWNDRENRPFSFRDYPLPPKLLFYKKGLDEVHVMNKYAGLLCSLHYSSFFIDSEQADSRQFLLKERERQEALFEELNYIEKAVEANFRLLQLCDDLSLYLCLNEPGVKKDDELAWYKEGFTGSEMFNSKEYKPLIAHWLDVKTIRIKGAPYKDPFHVNLTYKAVSKKRVKESGIERAYKESEWKRKSLLFTK